MPPVGNPAADQHIRSTIKAIAGASDLYAHLHASGAAATAPMSPAEALVAAHHVTDMLSQSVFYPAHAKRTESKAYAAIHKQLVKVLDLACLACGVRNSTIGTKSANPFGAKAIETHHHVVEWALANAIDLGKFNHQVVAARHRRDPNDATYSHDFTQQEMLDWIDHHQDNLWVLCDVHHRHKFLGIHAITMPIWGPQDLLKPGFGPEAADKLAGASGAVDVPG